MWKTVLAILAGVVIILIGLFWPRSYSRGYTHENAPWEEPQVVHNVLTPDECQQIIQKADPKFARSSLVGIDGPDSSRTSETAWISRDDPLARKIFDKVCQLTGKDFENCEDLQVVRYKPGTFYRAHHDSCCEDSEACRSFENQGGQRVGTLLVYLNSEFQDGETHFPKHGDVKMRANPGSAIFFRPLGSDEAKCHPKALHAGLPITSGTKYVCNAWVREGNFK
jgi:prolyl 4-hydroxylase